MGYSENGISQFMCGGIFKDNYYSPSFITTDIISWEKSIVAQQQYTPTQQITLIGM